MFVLVCVVCVVGVIEFSASITRACTLQMIVCTYQYMMDMTCLKYLSVCMFIVVCVDSDHIVIKVHIHTAGRPDVRTLFNALKNVSDWHQLGIQLGIPTSELRKIEEEYQRSDRRKTVVSALQQIGENTVAESVCQTTLEKLQVS